MRRIGTCTCIIKNTEILVGKRGPGCKRGHGCYALPGGKLDDGESIIASGAREVLEETGLVVSYPDRPFEIACMTVTDHFPQQDKLTIWLYAYYRSGTPVNTEPDKCYGWEWRTLDWLNQNVPGIIDPSTEDYYWLPLPLLRHHLASLMVPITIGPENAGDGGQIKRRVPKVH